MTTHEKSGPESLHLRAVPTGPWSRTVLVAFVLFLTVMGAWEAYWRIGREFVPAYREGYGLWSVVHRRVEREPTGSTAIIGSSRVLFDFNLDVWEDLTGRPPIQLALPGTNPRPILEHLATETDFAGALIVGVTPPIFFTPPGSDVYGEAVQYAKDESPSQRAGQQLSMLVEPRLAFYHVDTALPFILRRQTWWPARDGYTPPPRIVRRIEVTRRNRQTDMWHMVEDDAETQALAQDIWRDYIYMPVEMPPPEVAAQMLQDIMDTVSRHVQMIRDRGGEVVFVRMPSTSEFREVELQGFPRQVFWDRLLIEAEAVGVHFEDHPELMNARLPEWSHLHSDDTAEFTSNLITILRDRLAAAGITRPELGP